MPATSLSVNIPFLSYRNARVALNSLAVDPEPPRSRIQSSFSLVCIDGVWNLRAEFTCAESSNHEPSSASIEASLRALRVSMGAFIERADLVIGTISRFDLVSK